MKEVKVKERKGERERDFVERDRREGKEIIIEDGILINNNKYIYKHMNSK